MSGLTQCVVLATPGWQPSSSVLRAAGRGSTWQSGRQRQRMHATVAVAAIVCVVVSAAVIPRAGLDRSSSSSSEGASTRPAVTGRSYPLGGKVPLADAPAALQDVLAATVDGNRYRIAPAGGERFHAVNAAHGLRAVFSSSGLELRIDGVDLPLNLSTVAYGYPEGMVPVDPVTPTYDGGRVEYPRGGLVEWYGNDPRGIEQGFSLVAPPASGAGPLEVIMHLDGGLEAALAGDRIVLSEPGRPPSVSYHGLVTIDAAGRRLPSWLDVRGGDLVLAVDDSGASYPVTIDPFITSETMLTAPGGYLTGSVALSGDTAIAGAPYDAGASEFSGAAYVFVRSGTTWALQQKLVAPDATSEAFGTTVALSGDTAVVGAPEADGRMGAAHVFVRSGGVWTHRRKLSPPNGNSANVFGVSVAVEGNTIVVGDQYGATERGDTGLARVYVGSGDDWVEQGLLTAADGARLDAFGTSVAISGDTVIVGAPYDDDAGLFGVGSAWVFVRSGSTWTPQQKIRATDLHDDQVLDDGDHFGWSVAVNGNTALIGAPLDDTPASRAGTARVFVRSGETWTAEATLRDPSGDYDGHFGLSLALGEDTAVVGAVEDRTAGQAAGSILLFHRSEGTWSLLQKLDGHFNEFLGRSVALAGDTIAATGDGVVRVFRFKLIDPNAAPVAANDRYVHYGSDTPLTVPAPLGVLANDVDADGDALRVIAFTPPGAGKLVLNEDDGSFSYQPTPDLVGTVRFMYQIYDTIAVSQFATVTITVEPGCRGQRATVTGTGGADRLIGTDGADVISGLAGPDVILAGSGDDIVCGGAGDDTINAGAGDDYVNGELGADTLRGDTGDDVLVGGPGTDTLMGDAGDDTLAGGLQNDICKGDTGTDTLADAGCEDVRDVP